MGATLLIKTDKLIVLFAAGCFLWAACVAYTSQPAIVTGTPIAHVPPPKEKKLVAIAGFENKSTYSADKLWDTSAQLLNSELIRTSYFRVVAWDQIKLLVDWDTLSTCSLFQKPESLSKVQALLCEYFIIGTIIRFDVTQRSNISALSKKKEFETTIRVDLTMMDAQTGEYVSQGTGEYSAVQIFSGGVGGGQTGTWDPASANSALESAIRSALSQLILSFSRK